MNRSLNMIARISDWISLDDCDKNLTWYNEAELNSTEQIRQIAYQIIAPITIFIGILGNILNLLVLTTKPFLKGATRVYFTALAISDLMVMITIIPMIQRWNLSYWKTFGAAYYHAHIELFINNIFVASSVFIVVCLTIERYFSVCLPTMFRSVHTIRIAKFVTVGCYVGAVIVSLPLTGLKNVCLQNESLGEWDFHENKEITDTIYWHIYLLFSEFTIRLGPCIILAILNILIIKKFRKITAKRKIFREALTQTKNRNLFECVNSKKLNSALKNKKYLEEKRLINLLGSIVILFFITMTPSAALSFLYAEKTEPSYYFQIFRAAANNLELANFSLNFYVYFLCSKEFRRSLFKIFTGCGPCKNETVDLESIDIDADKFKIALKIFKLSDTSDFNSTSERIVLQNDRKPFYINTATM